MLKLIDGILQQFRICFKREETFAWFVIIVVGMLIRTEMKGVSSMIGCLCLEPRYYETMLHFFRSKAFDDLSSVTEKRDKEKIVLTMQAIEIFSFISCIAMGILTIISLKLPHLVWDRFFGWLRTRSSETPSVETVRSALQQELWRNNHKVSSYATLSSIHKYQKSEDSIPYRPSA